MWREIKKIINQHDSFLISTHINPDGDGVGSACALGELLFQMGKRVLFVCQGEVPSKFSFLNYHNFYQSYRSDADYDDYQVLFVLDTNRLDRIGSLSDIVHSRDDLITVCIDHHEHEDLFADYSAITPGACSVGAMIYTLYKECGYDLNLESATGIYTAILCDTGRFSYSSTNRKAYKISDECVRAGVDPDLIYFRIFQHISLDQVAVFREALNSMVCYFDNKLFIQHIRSSVAGDNINDLDYIHDFNKRVEGFYCTAIIKDSGDEVRISVRTKLDFPLDIIMEKIGGGGHPKAAGAIFKGSAQEAEKFLLEELEQYINY